MKLSEVIKNLEEAQEIFNKLDMDPDVVIGNDDILEDIHFIRSLISHTGSEVDCQVILKS